MWALDICLGTNNMYSIIMKNTIGNKSGILNKTVNVETSGKNILKIVFIQRCYRYHLLSKKREECATTIQNYIYMKKSIKLKNEIIKINKYYGIQLKLLNCKSV